MTTRNQEMLANLKKLQNWPHMISLACVTFTVKVNIPPTDDMYNWTSITLQKKRLPRRKLLKDANDFVQNINITERAEKFNQCVSCWCVGIDHDMCQLFLVNLIYWMLPDNFFVFVVFLRIFFSFFKEFQESSVLMIFVVAVDCLLRLDEQHWSLQKIGDQDSEEQS